MNRCDKFLLAGILLTSLLMLAALYGRFSRYAPPLKATEAVVIVRGTIIRRIPLPSAGKNSFAVQGESGAATVEIEGTRVRMREALCPGQVCVKQGWISHPGQTVACIPGRILIRIEGTAALDAVTR